MNHCALHGRLARLRHYKLDSRIRQRMPAIRTKRRMLGSVTMAVCLYIVCWPPKEQESLVCELDRAPPAHQCRRGPAQCQATFVTQYFKIPSKHSHAEYKEWIANMQDKACLLVFTDSPALYQDSAYQVVIPTGVCEEGRALNR